MKRRPTPSGVLRHNQENRVNGIAGFLQNIREKIDKKRVRNR